MKHVCAIFLGMLFCHLPATAQHAKYSTGTYRPRGPKKPPSYQIAYIGFSGGVNNPVGVAGVQLDFDFTQRASVNTGIGLSSWGYKTAVEGRYYFKPCNRGWAVAAGITYNTGGKNVKINNIETGAGKTTVTANLNPMAAIMFSAYHFFNIGYTGTNRFHLQLGYSIPLSAPRVTYLYNYYAPQPTEKGRSTVQSLAPGGVILGLGFSFGTGKSR